MNENQVLNFKTRRVDIFIESGFAKHRKPRSGDIIMPCLRHLRWSLTLIFYKDIMPSAFGLSIFNP